MPKSAVTVPPTAAPIVSMPAQLAPPSALAAEYSVADTMRGKTACLAGIAKPASSVDAIVQR